MAPPCIVRCPGGVFLCAGLFLRDWRGSTMSIDQGLSIVQDEACGVDRRGFLGRCAGCALASGCAAGAWSAPALGKPARGPETGRECGWSSATSHRASRPGPTSAMTTRRGSGSLTAQLVQRLPRSRVPAGDGARRRCGAAPDLRGQGARRSPAISSTWSASGPGPRRRSPRPGNRRCSSTTSTRAPASS